MPHASLSEVELLGCPRRGTPHRSPDLGRPVNRGLRHARHPPGARRLTRRVGRRGVGTSAPQSRPVACTPTSRDCAAPCGGQAPRWRRTRCCGRTGPPTVCGSISTRATCAGSSATSPTASRLATRRQRREGLTCSTEHSPPGAVTPTPACPARSSNESATVSRSCDCPPRNSARRCCSTLVNRANSSPNSPNWCGGTHCGNALPTVDARIARRRQNHPGALSCYHDARLVLQEELVSGQARRCARCRRAFSPEQRTSPAGTAQVVTTVRPRECVGRLGEVRLLDDLVTGVAAGRGQVVWVEGEEGIGKSRLLEVGLSHAAEAVARSRGQSRTSSRAASHSS